MAVSPFRFLHFDQLALDRPLKETGPVSEELAEQIVLIPFQVLDNLLNSALEQEVDAVLVTGTLFGMTPASLPNRAAFSQLASQLFDAGIELILAPETEEWQLLPGEFKDSLSTSTVLTSGQPSHTCAHRDSDSARFTLIIPDRLHQVTPGNHNGIQIAIIEKQHAGSSLRETFNHVVKVDTSTQSGTLVTVHHSHSSEQESLSYSSLKQLRRTLGFQPETTLVDLLSQMQQQIDQLDWEPRETIGLIHWEAKGSGPLLHSLNDVSHQQELQRQLRSNRPLVHRWTLLPLESDLTEWAKKDQLAEQFLQLLDQYKEVGHSDLLTDMHSTFAEHPEWNHQLKQITKEISPAEVYNEACLQGEHFLAFPAETESTTSPAQQKPYDRADDNEVAS